MSNETVSVTLARDVALTLHKYASRIHAGIRGVEIADASLLAECEHLGTAASAIDDALHPGATALREGVKSVTERVRSRSVNRVSDDEEPWDANQIRSAYP